MSSQRDLGGVTATCLALVAAAVSPLLYPVAASGYATLHDLALAWLIPSVVVIVCLGILSLQFGWGRLARGLIIGGAIGAVSTVGLEVIRVVGFRAFQAMPGSMPMLLGVLLTNRIMEGPNLVSNLLGWSYHFWNGAAFGMIYALLLGRRPWWTGTIYGLLIGTGFMLSPAVVSMGVGYFGVSFGPGFASTVILAHLVFGTLVGWLTARASVSSNWLLPYVLQGLHAPGTWSGQRQIEAHR